MTDTGTSARTAANAKTGGTAELARLVRELAVVRGPVTLSSGQRSDHYFNLRRVSLHPRGARLIGAEILRRADDWAFDVVAGLALGAVPVAIAVMNAAYGLGAQIEAAAIRKEAKRHGLARQIEGATVSGRRVLVVEDVSTTGESTLAAIRVIETAGGSIIGAILVVDRGGGRAVAAAGVPVRGIFTPRDLL